jgi:PadR family transcriptional regulator PadR
LTYLINLCIIVLGMDLSKDLIAASSTPFVLAIISKGDNYGYAIIKLVKKLSESNIQWTEGMLYPVLHRLKEQGYINDYWKTAQSGRKRKYYTITESGFAYLRELKLQWKTVDSTLNKLWDNKNVL